MHVYTCVFQLFACVKNRSGENKNVHGCDCKQVYIETFPFEQYLIAGQHNAVY